MKKIYKDPTKTTNSIIYDFNPWIFVADRLPDKDIKCICFMGHGHDEFGIFRGYYRLATYTNERFYSASENISKDVTHWMPLPEPPQ